VYQDCSPQLRQEVHQALEVSGGATGSIFPQVEALLISDGDWQAALEYVAARKDMKRYRSMIDFLFCELHPRWRGACKRFYEDRGPLLKEMISVEELDHFNKRLLGALEVARKLYQEQSCKSFAWYRYCVVQALEAA